MLWSSKKLVESSQKLDLAGILGGCMASAEGGSVPSGVGYVEGYYLFGRLGGMGKRRELPQRGLGHSPGRKLILAYFEGHIMLLLYLYDKNLRGTVCISVPLLQILGTCLPIPRDLRPCHRTRKITQCYCQLSQLGPIFWFCERYVDYNTLQQCSWLM